MPRRSPDFQLLFETRHLVSEIVETRRDLHRHPELGFCENRTAGIVAERLRGLGLEVRTGVAKTGVVGLLRGARPGKTLLVRADMDALPLPEERETPYRSQVESVMHACGHDGHVAIALAAAKVLAARRSEIAGNVKLCFQPAEEGPGGAEPMIAEGVLRDPPVDAAIGLHIWNDLDIGQLGIGVGPMLAAEDEFGITVEGVGGHGAYPQDTVDPVVVASHIVVALQSIVSRNVGALEPAVVTVGTIKAGYAINIIPRTAVLTGTLRSYDEGVRATLVRRVKEIAEGVAGAFGARIQFAHDPGYPATVNDKAMSAFAAEHAAATFGAKNVVEPRRSMGAEDMSYYLREVPGTFLFLGSRNPDRGLDAPHHSPLFDFDEAALPAGTDVFVRTALAFLR
ncbi:MAG: amidohydrolase [Acidobacteriota bacterium]